jgi:biopolymer transport protein ExbD
MRNSKKNSIGQELEMKPFVNFMITLIPVLIMSVEFAKIAVIDMKLPEGRGSTTESAQTVAPEEDLSNKLLLTAIITDSVVTLGAKGGFLPSVFYREYHHYISSKETDQNLMADFVVEYKPGAVVKHPKTGREMTMHERHDIYLYVCDEERNPIKALYTKTSNLITDAEGKIIASVKAGDTVYALTEPRMRIVVRDPAELHLADLSAYDELRNRLMQVKMRFATADDGEDIIIAAENEVLYDKIVQIMDAARLAGFPNIAIAKLRA